MTYILVFIGKTLIHISLSACEPGEFGYVRFIFDDESRQLTVSTSYRVYEDLPDDQLKQLISGTEAQWSDGIGSGSFSGRGREIPSATLAMAMQNSGQDPSQFSDLFVDAYPDEDNRTITHKFHTGLMPSDWLLLGIIAIVLGLLVWWLL